jgi:3-methyl-2-oxobutanoate hydroxymethyltransferase
LIPLILAESVKLEGGAEVAESVRRIVQAGIPVMGHIGLTPQSIHAMGGHRVQGRSAEARDRLIGDARALEDSGVFAIVLEGIPLEAARDVTLAVDVPTIGIDCESAPWARNEILRDLTSFQSGTAREDADSVHRLRRR